jgi:hypothetical protein
MQVINMKKGDIAIPEIFKSLLALAILAAVISILILTTYNKIKGGLV